MEEQYSIKVAIIGCGLIGTQWEDIQSSCSLNHAAAFMSNTSSKLVAVCDQDQSKAEQAATRWGHPKIYCNFKELFAEEVVDLVVIATPSFIRWQVIEAALAAGIKYFVIEKPLATTLLEARKIMTALEYAGARALVNFSRRWDPAMRSLRQRIASDEFGTVQRLLGLYGKGLVNNGSHMIDLVSNICDAHPIRIRVLGSPLPLSEKSWSKNEDPSLDVQIIFRNVVGHEFHLDLLGTDHLAFTCFELKIIARKAVCEITQGGRDIKFKTVIADPNFANYKILDNGTNLPARGIEALDFMAEEAIQMAQGSEQRLSCDMYAAINTAMVIEAIKRAALKEGSWIELDSIKEKNIKELL